jgi:uncharacterized protein (TIGR03435 family)
LDPTAPGGDLSPDPSSGLAKAFACPGMGGPAMFTAIQDQLGFKLESTKAPVDELVIDHLERPSEN